MTLSAIAISVNMNHHLSEKVTDIILCISLSNKSAYGLIIFWMGVMQLLCSYLSFSIITHVFSVCRRLVKRKVNQNNQIALYGKTLKFRIRTKENPSWCRKENIQVIEIL